MKARKLSLRILRRLPAILAFFLAGSWSTHLAAQSSPSPYTSATRYDLVGRVTGTIAPDPDGAGPLLYLAVRNSYDAAGRLTKVESGQLNSWFSEATAPASWSGFDIKKTVETTYNAQDLKTLEVVRGDDLIATSATQYSYDNFGRLECTAIRMNPPYGSLPPSACTWATGPYGDDRITRNYYNARGDLTKVQKGVGSSLVQDYATYTYSPNGNRTSVFDARSYKATMAYDGLDRQTRWYFPSPTTTGSASTTDFESYAYDANSNRTSLKKRDNSTLNYQYDALNRMTVKVVPERAGLDPSHTRDVYYSYDSFGRMTSARFDSTSGEGISTGFDGFSEVTSAGVSLTGLSASLSFQFDADGNRTRVTYGDTNYVTYGYDGLDRSNSVLRSGSTTLVNYTYNARGARATIGGNFATSYDYHPDGRLSTLTNTPIQSGFSAQYTFGYNPASQIIQQTRNNDAFAWTGAVNGSQSYSTNGLNQYTAVAGAAHTYDANGNLTSDGATTYLYDIENRLVSASGAKNATLRYDPMGRLYETSGGTAGLTRFAYDGDALVQEFNSGGTLLRRYVHGTDTGDDPIVWFEGSGFTDTQQRLLRSDQRGSIVVVADATSASIIAVNTYGEYGEQGQLNQGRFQYTGQTWISELGLYYYKARMYSPTLGRFMQTDPVGYTDDLNLYAYVSSDPINKTDPDGKFGLAGAIYGAIAGAVGGYVASGGSFAQKIVGTVAGAIAGAVVGVVAPHTSSFVGMAVAGAIASATGQAIGSTATAAMDKGIANVSMSDVKVSATTTIAGGLGAGVGGIVAKGIAGMTAQAIVGNTVQAAGTPTAAGLAAGAVAEGATIGASEKLAPAAVKAVTGTISAVKTGQPKK